MSDYNIFAILYPLDLYNKAASAFNLNPDFLYPATGGVASTPTISSRETTPANDNDEGTPHRLVLHFDKLNLKIPSNGIQAGSNPITSDILLGLRGTSAVSSKQFNITVDSELRVWLHDYYSTHGTIVSHDNQNINLVRRKETWMLSDKPGQRAPFKDIVIKIGRLEMAIELPNHRIGHSEYVQKLTNYAQKSQQNQIPFNALGLDDSLTTKHPTGQWTPGEGPLYFRHKKLGQGAFATVYKIIRLRDGKVFAGKYFLPKKRNNKRKHETSDPNWLVNIRREFSILQDLDHVSMKPSFALKS